MWMPVWGGDSFTFFSPIWNFADACISVGVFAIILGTVKALFSEPKAIEDTKNNYRRK